jgi:hypothetical protein
MGYTNKFRPHKFRRTYIPESLTRKDKRKQLSMLKNSRNLYKKRRFYTRNKVDSFVSKPSRHILKARKLYKVEHILPSKELAAASGCPVSVLEQIVKKGEGAYYSSGSRPNQTAQSWAYARLASALTGGKSARVDFHLVSQCDKKKPAYRLAQKVITG